MPTRRQAAAAAKTTQAAPAPLPLEGLTLTITGKFEKFGYSQSTYQDLIKQLGGKVAASVTKACTHVVATEEEYLNNGNKVAAGFKDSKLVVDPQWVVDCEAEGKKVDEADYEHSGPQLSGAVPNPNANPRGVKRSASTLSNKGSDPKKAKDTKTNGTNGTNGTNDVQANGQNDDKSVKKEAKEERQVAEGQFMKMKNTTIPVDDHCPLSNWQVHVDPDTGMIWDASLNQSNSGRNNNKFYRIQILRDNQGSFKTWTRWGRVGEIGQSALLGTGSLADATRNFEKKFRDKSGLSWENRGNDPKPNKYAFVERSYNEDSDDEADEKDGRGVTNEDEEEDIVVESKLDQATQDLMALIFNQQYFQQTMISLNYDANKLPLGKLSKATITRGFQQLKDLAALMDDSTLASSRWNMTVGAATEHLSNTYYSLIPHAFGRNRPPVISQHFLLKKEIELLESLSDMKDAAEIMKVDKKNTDTVHPLDRQFQGLQLNEMTTLDHSSNEFTMLANYLVNFTGSTHNVNYKVEQIFRIERQGEKDRFDASPYATIKSDRRLLWHGSRATNFGGILSQGLRIAPPEAPSTGYMFGKGIYLADMSSKSANYCCSYNTGGTALLLLCEAELGDPMQKLTSASYTAGDTAKANGMVSTWGMGRTSPEQWMDAGVVHESLKGIKMPDSNSKASDVNIMGHLLYNEYICYDVAQVRLRYLLRVKM